MGTSGEEVGSFQRSLRVENFTPKYICWVVLGFAGLSLPTGGGAFSKKLGSYERSLLGKILHLNISVGLSWVWRA